MLYALYDPLHPQEFRYLGDAIDPKKGFAFISAKRERILINLIEIFG
jgi:hypothetical protein